MLRALVLFSALSWTQSLLAADQKILVAAWDGSSRLFGDLARVYETAHPGQRIVRSHGGSSRQARAVLDGLPADALCVSEAADLDLLAAKGRLPQDWRQRFPHQGVPFGSPVVMVVRPGNPQGVRDWADLADRKVDLIMANPSSSGSGRVNHLALLAWTRAKHMDEAATLDFFRHYYGHTLSLESGSRGATLAFFERGLGDVLICWQSEASLALKRWPQRGQVVWPSVTLMAEPRMATLSPAGQAWVDFLFTPPALALAREHGFVPVDSRPDQAGVRWQKAASLGDEHTLHEEQFGRSGLLARVLEKR